MQIKDIESGIDYLNKMKAIETWAQAEKKDAELQNIIAEQKLRTQRVLGQLIKDGQKNGELAKKGENKHNSLIHDGDKRTLTEIGISPQQSSDFQAIAAIPEKKFEDFITEKKTIIDNAVKELTTAGALRLAKDVKKEDATITTRDKKLIEELKAGKTVVVNQRTDLYAIKWAEDHGLYLRADRYSDWGNPFEMGKDGDRDEVCDNYKAHYLPFKPSLLKRINTLKGKALGCWCAPERCHCDELKAMAK